MGEAKREVLAWVDSHLSDLSDWHDALWHFAEPAFREYKSSAWYIDCLHAAGFTVEIGSGGMLTAFAASFTNGRRVIVRSFNRHCTEPSAKA